MTLQEWYTNHCQLSGTEIFCIRDKTEKLSVKPLISLLTPVYNTKPKWLRKCIDSVLNQIYPYWELCLCDNASNSETSQILAEYVTKDPRIKVVRLEVNQGGASGTNAALDLATGDWIGFLDSDDELIPQSLYLIAEKSDRHPDSNVIFTDEALIDENGQVSNVLLKPDFSPHSMCSQLLVSHLSLWRGDLLRRLRMKESTGSHDYDLTLRTMEMVPWKSIYHVPFLAYRYRIHSNSTASKTYSYCVAGAIKALEEHLERIDCKATVYYEWPWYRVKFHLETQPHVDLLVASINKNNILFSFIDNILAKTDYTNYSIILAVPEKVKEAITLRHAVFIESGKIKFAERDESLPFNYSVLANNLNRASTSPYICLMNDDVEPLNHNWLEEMLSLAMQPETGVVGAKLLYPNLTYQHVGVAMGLGGTAAHLFKHQMSPADGYFGRAKLVGNCSIVTGACALMRKEIYDEVGGFDEKFKVAYNDADFCIKVMQAGYYNVYTPYASLLHRESSTRGPDTSPEQVKTLEFETNYLKEKWANIITHDPFYNPHFTLRSVNCELVDPKEARYKKPWLK